MEFYIGFFIFLQKSLFHKRLKAKGVCYQDTQLSKEKIYLGTLKVRIGIRQMVTIDAYDYQK